MNVWHVPPLLVCCIDSFKSWPTWRREGKLLVVQSRGDSMTKWCSLLLLCKLVVYFRISKHPFSFYGCFLKSDFERMHFRCRFFFFFSKALVMGTKELDHASKGNQFCLIVECPHASVVEHPKFLSISSFFFLIRSHFPALNASIGLDIVNLSIELSCVVTVVPFPHQVVVQRCMMGCFSLH